MCVNALMLLFDPPLICYFDGQMMFWGVLIFSHNQTNMWVMCGFHYEAFAHFLPQRLVFVAQRLAAPEPDELKR